MSHEYAHLMRMYAEDAERDSIPWRWWEYYDEYNFCWIRLSFHPKWFLARQYRRRKDAPPLGYSEPEEMYPDYEKFQEAL